MSAHNSFGYPIFYQNIYNAIFFTGNIEVCLECKFYEILVKLFIFEESWRNSAVTVQVVQNDSLTNVEVLFNEVRNLIKSFIHFCYHFIKFHNFLLITNLHLRTWLLYIRKLFVNTSCRKFIRKHVSCFCFSNRIQKENIGNIFILSGNVSYNKKLF